MGRNGGKNGYFSSSTKGFKRYQNQGCDEPYEKTDSAAALGVPLYMLTKGVLGTEVAALLMVAVMLPFFFLAMYEKDGFPAEKILYFMLRQKVLTPGIRPYKSENIHKQLEEREKIKKEVRYLEQKATGRATKVRGKK